MEVIVNNEKVSTQAENLEQLIAERLPDAKGTAVAIGMNVIPRAEWGNTPLTENVTITIIRATRGG